ncbi:transposase family protein [Streptomyces sp. NPDC001165]|uniref:transposase family protein n=1 Tax=Streptomyces sp. NPDC001165 TaxID=3364546 RepID=UPI0036B9A3DB
MPARSSSLIPRPLGQRADTAPTVPDDLPGLLTCLAQVPDPRRDQGRRHPLAFVLSLAACGSALEQLAAEGLVTLHDGYRLYSVGTMTPAERAYRLIRTVIHRSYLPGERFMNRDEIARTFEIGAKEAAAAVRQLVAEGLLVGPRGQYVNEYSPQQQRRRVKQLRERAKDLRREALELMKTAREIEQQMDVDVGPQDA